MGHVTRARSFFVLFVIRAGLKDPEPDQLAVIPCQPEQTTGVLDVYATLLRRCELAGPPLRPVGEQQGTVHTDDYRSQRFAMATALLFLCGL